MHVKAVPSFELHVVIIKAQRKYNMLILLYTYLIYVYIDMLYMRISVQYNSYRG